MSHNQPRHLQDVTLQLPSGEQYRLEVSDEELAEWLTPGDQTPHKPGVISIRIEVSRTGRHAVIPIGAGKLERLLSRARHAMEAEPPIRPKPVHDPTSGRGVHDPAAHRLGPNADQSPDPTHRGPKRLRRLP